jgi:hypothetical protein
MMQVLLHMSHVACLCENKCTHAWLVERLVQLSPVGIGGAENGWVRH